MSTNMMDELLSRVAALTNLTPLCAVPDTICQVTLRKYQIDGMNWLISKYKCQMGCILADEMGLGKTLQTIAFLAHIRQVEKNKGPFLIIAPLSVIQNWNKEFEKTCPTLQIFTYIGTIAQRNAKQGEILQHMDEAAIPTSVPFDVMITTYEVALKDAKFLLQLQWDVLIVDESHRLKNCNSLLFTTLTKLQVQHRVILTGTPLQNNISELWCWLHFCAPLVFDQQSKMEALFGTDCMQNLQQLQIILRAFLLRRLKSDVTC